MNKKIGLFIVSVCIFCFSFMFLSSASYADSMNGDNITIYKVINHIDKTDYADKEKQNFLKQSSKPVKGAMFGAIEVSGYTDREIIDSFNNRLTNLNRETSDGGLFVSCETDCSGKASMKLPKGKYCIFEIDRDGSTWKRSLKTAPIIKSVDDMEEYVIYPKSLSSKKSQNVRNSHNDKEDFENNKIQFHGNIKNNEKLKKTSDGKKNDIEKKDDDKGKFMEYSSEDRNNGSTDTETDNNKKLIKTGSDTIFYIFGAGLLVVATGLKIYYF